MQVALTYNMRGNKQQPPAHSPMTRLARGLRFKIFARRTKVLNFFCG